jgi:hypothetical protein
MRLTLDIDEFKVAGVLAVETAARKTKPAVAGLTSTTSEAATAEVALVAAISIARASIGTN